MRGVDQHEPHHLVGVGAGVQPVDESAERVADQHVRTGDVRRGEQGMEIIDRILDRDRRGDRIARTASGVRPVVGADPREGRNSTLNREPGSSRVVAARLQHDGGTARANTREVDLVAVDVEQPIEASRLGRSQLAFCQGRLVSGTRSAAALPVAVAPGAKFTPVMRCGARLQPTAARPAACRSGRSGAR